MSQTATPQAAPPPPVPQAVPAPPVPAAAPQAAAAHVDTPALLNRWQLIGMSTAIVFGLLSALVQFVGWQSDGRAAADTAQLVRVQQGQASLLSADALATNAFLNAGLGDADQQAAYDAAIASVLTGIAEAAEAQPQDQDALARLSAQVSAYTTAVAQARANNRQGFPVGAAYQTLASDGLRTPDGAIAVLDELVKANGDRAESAMGGQHPIWLLLLGVAALAALWWLNRSLAQAFRRRVNKGVAIGAAIVAVVTLVTVAGAWLRDSSNDGLREGAFKDARDSAVARTAGNDAKANESLRLIKRGSGAANEESWEEAAAQVDTFVPSEARTSWDAYKQGHAALVEADEGNDWEGAVAIATDPGEGSASAQFALFDDTTAKAVAKDSEAAVDDLDSGRSIALVLSILTVLLGVAAAVAVARGIGERRREFS